MDVEAVDAGQDTRTDARRQDGGGERFDAPSPLLDGVRMTAYAARVEKGKPVWFSLGANALAPRLRARALPRRRYEGTWIMQQQISVITLGIADIARSKRDRLQSGVADPGASAPGQFSPCTCSPA